MAEDYPSGKQRIWYRSTGFREELLVQAEFLSPSFLEYKDLIFKEKNGGRYYLDFDFTELGNWLAIFYEDGEKVATQGYRIYLSDEVSYPRIIRVRGNILW